MRAYGVELGRFAGLGLTDNLARGCSGRQWDALAGTGLNGKSDQLIKIVGHALMCISMVTQQEVEVSEQHAYREFLRSVLRK